MRILTLLLALLLLLPALAAAQLAPTPDPSQEGTACRGFKWHPPAEYLDGRALDPAQITAYRIYQQPPPLPDGTVPGWVQIALLPVSTLPDPAAPTWQPASCDPQTCWLVAAVLDGEESFISNTYCEPPPSGPRVGPPWGLGRDKGAE